MTAATLAVLLAAAIGCIVLFCAAYLRERVRRLRVMAINDDLRRWDEMARKGVAAANADATRLLAELAAIHATRREAGKKAAATRKAKLLDRYGFGRPPPPKEEM